MKHYRIVFILITSGLLLNINLTCKSIKDKNEITNSRNMDDEDKINSMDSPEKEIIAIQKVMGGLIPIEREWIFYANGEVKHPNGSVSILSDEQIRIMKNLFMTKERFENIDTLYAAPLGSADYTTMELQYFPDQEIKKIRIEDTNSEVPETFWDLWDELQDAAEKSLINSKKEK
jgi:hypothetical protein